MAEDRAARLDDLVWDEVSGVDHPAHLKEGWLVMKSRDALSGAESALRKGHDMAETDAEEIIEEALDNAEEEEEPTEADAEETSDEEEEEEPMAKSTEGAEALDLDDDEVFKSLPAPIRDQITKARNEAAAAQAAADEANTELRKERERRRDEQFVAKAADLAHLPEFDAETFGPVIRKMADQFPEEAEALFDVLAKANGALESASIFSELGTGGGQGGGATDTYSKLQTVAKGLQEADPNLTEAQAITKALAADPDLYVEHLRESKER